MLKNSFLKPEPFKIVELKLSFGFRSKTTIDRKYVYIKHEK